MREPTRRIIERLAEEYLKSSDYHRSFITKNWIDKVTDELDLRNLSDYELCNMWDMVYLTLDHRYVQYREDFKKGMDYIDVQSAFTEVVNVEARRRRGQY